MCHVDGHAVTHVVLWLTRAAHHHGRELVTALAKHAEEVVVFDVARGGAELVLVVSTLGMRHRLMLRNGHVCNRLEAADRVQRGLGLLELVWAAAEGRVEGGGYGRAEALRCERGWVGR